MGVQFLINTTRICLAITLISSLLSLGGGSLVLPPFKSLSWLKTNTTNVGLCGACLSASLSENLFGGAEDGWKELQGSQCVDLFSQKEQPASMTGRLSSRDEIMLSAIMAFSVIFNAAALFTTSARRPQTSTILIFTSFVFQATSFALGVYQFRLIWEANSAAGANFGIGMYLSGAVCLVLLLAGGIGWSVAKTVGADGYKEFSSFRDSRQDTYF